ncbi:hypothetical protein [Burkholderia cenocepacia]|uniref:hypothetical protein n=1 Tax=Burkholderia cenocepacia TaxID=95486 RepID=UPI0007614E88|nr:hypothetical protein [Burkholderia cenocepacia]KWU24720.1 hypothetical protein AS149_31740 [Burkholderia cenocepacia]
MNTNTHTHNPATQHLSAAETLAEQWPFEISAWPSLVAPVYASMPTQERFSLGRTLRDRARNKGKLTPAQHLLYAVLKGKSPFRTFSPISTTARLGAGQLAWGGLLAAVGGAEQELRSLEAAGGADCVLLAKLRQILLMTRLRALGLSIVALPKAHRARRRYLLDQAMALTPQGRGTVKQHCIETHTAYLRLLSHFERGSGLSMPIPAWAETWKKELLAGGLTSKALMRDYLTMHDCGKGFCLKFDESGRPHFPNHAALSARVWLELGGSLRVASLIAQDMDLHTLKPEDVGAFAERPDAELLLLSGIASLHANAEDFGGAASDSFKIKLKRLSSRGARVAEIRFRTAEA